MKKANSAFGVFLEISAKNTVKAVIDRLRK
jgi:hypothetical protein